MTRSVPGRFELTSVAVGIWLAFAVAVGTSQAMIVEGWGRNGYGQCDPPAGDDFTQVDVADRFAPAPGPHADTVTLTSVASGPWDDPATWDDGQHTPSERFAVVVGDHTVMLSREGEAFSLSVDGSDGQLVVGGSLTVANGINVAGGRLEVASGGTLSAKIAGDQARSGTDGTGQLVLHPGSTLSIESVVPLNAMSRWPVGDVTYPVVAAGEIQGSFSNQPAPGEHLGRGTFCRAVSYGPEGIEVDVMMAEWGDADGDGEVNGHDIQRLVGARTYGTDVPADWTTGDWWGDGRFAGCELSSILAADLFGMGPYASADPVPRPHGMLPGAVGDGVVDLVLTPVGLMIDADGVALDSYVLSSQAGGFTGPPANDSPWSGTWSGMWQEINNSGGYGYLPVQYERIAASRFVPDPMVPPISGTFYLGNVFGQQFAGIDPYEDLTMTYTVADQIGVYHATLREGALPGLTWDGLGNGDWHSAGRWVGDSGGPPDGPPNEATPAAVYADTVTVARDAAASSLIVATDGAVVVDPDVTLEVVGEMQVRSGTLDVEGSVSAAGAQITAGTVRVYGTGSFGPVEIRSGTMAVLGEATTQDVTVRSGGTLRVQGTLDASRVSLDHAGIEIGPAGLVNVTSGRLYSYTGTYCAFEMDGTGNGLIVVNSGSALLRGTELSIEAVDKVGVGLAGIGNHRRTIIDNGEWAIEGYFRHVPSPGSHLGRGVFFREAIYGTEAPFTLDVVVFQAADGDTDGDRHLNGLDIQRILAADTFPDVRAADWTTGDFTGDGMCNGWDVQAIMATNLWDPGSLDPYAAADPDLPQTGPVNLVLTDQGLLIDTLGTTVNGYLLTSKSRIFNGDAAENLGLFREDGDGRVSGNLFFTLSGRHLLGDLIGTGHAGVDLREDLTFTYTVQGSPGVYSGNLVVPEPGTAVMLLAACMALLVVRRRTGG